MYISKFESEFCTIDCADTLQTHLNSVEAKSRISIQLAYRDGMSLARNNNR